MYQILTSICKLKFLFRMIKRKEKGYVTAAKISRICGKLRQPADFAYLRDHWAYDPSP